VACPYRGLTPYAEEDARFFFGRSQDSQLIVANLFSARVTVLFGPSGVGKSSVLRAGAMSELRRRQRRAIERGERPDLLIVYFRTWQGEIMQELRRTILAEATAQAGKPVTAPEGCSLADLLAHVAHELEADVMVLLDQFEEYFRYETRFGEPDSFAAQFAESVRRSGLPASFLLSLREDSLAELDRFKTLVPNLLTNCFRLDRLGLDAAEQAIRGPIEQYNTLPDSQREVKGTITLDEGLAAEVLEQVRTGTVVFGDAGRGTAREAHASVETPYLQLVLTELWEEEVEQGGRTLRVETLRRLGGAAAIVQRHVETVLGALSASERHMCARMFDYLVTDSGAKIAYRANDLAGKSGVDAAAMRTLLGKLAEGDKRILTTVAPAPDHPNEPQFEIYHDSLSRAVLAWRRHFVETQHRTRLALRIIAAAAVLLVMFGMYAYVNKQRLERRAIESRAREYEAKTQKAAAEADEALHQLQDALKQKGGDSAQVEQLQDEVKRRREEAAQYEKVARDLKSNPAQTVSRDVAERQLDLATKRASYAEGERDRYRKQADLLSKERDDLVQERDALRKSAGQRTVPAARVERWLCQLERIRIFEDGGAGDANWTFNLSIRSATGDPVQVTMPMVLNDGKPLVELWRNWPVMIDTANPLALIEITASNLDARTTTTVNGYADGSRARAVTVIMDEPRKGTIVFEFSLHSGAKAK
jgi:hypothetical protein